MKASDFLLTRLGEMGTLILAHGVGSSMDIAVMNFFAAGLGGRDWRVLRFESPTGWYGEFLHRTAHLNDATS